MPVDMSKGKMVELQATLTQHGEAYQGCSPTEPARRPPGVYACGECGDAQITFRMPVEEYKTKCPKCGTLMQRIAKITGT